MAKARTRIMFFNENTMRHFYVGPGEEIPEDYLDRVDADRILGDKEPLPGADEGDQATDGFDLQAATVEQVLAWAGDDENRVRRALNWEVENKGRATVVGTLQNRLS